MNTKYRPRQFNMEALLKLDEPIDIPLLDQVVKTFYSGSGEQQRQAGEVLTRFQSDPKAWTQTDRILEYSVHTQSKFIALSILDNLINSRWHSLPKEQKNGITNFIVGMILSLSKDSNGDNGLVQKADLILVQLLKKEWPETFIQDLISSSYVSTSVCKNNLYILRLMAEEIFDDIAEESLTQAKRFKLRQSLTQEFQQILTLCDQVLSQGDPNNPKASPLYNMALLTLNKYLDWIPMDIVFGSDLINTLIDKYLINSITRSNALKCLTTIVNFQDTHRISNFNNLIITYFQSILNIVNNNILPTKSTLDLNEIYNNSSTDDQLFLQDWELFLCTFLTRNRKVLEDNDDPAIKEQCMALLIQSHQYLIQLSRIDDKEMFKTAVDYWHDLVSALFIEIEHFPFDEVNPYMESISLGTGAINPMILLKFPLKRNLYIDICSQLRSLIIDHMVKPEEVQITFTEDGDFIKEVFTETDNIQLYETEREVLVLLTHLDVDDMESILSKRLVQLKEQNILFNNKGELFNKIVWAIGSISGTMKVEMEQTFLTNVLTFLWDLSTINMNKEQSLIYSSNIMFIVGQYSRFLKNHWSFFRKIMFQLFELMHNDNEAIRDVACDTFLKITKKCKYQMATVQDGDENNQPFIRTILENSENIISDLTNQRYIFFEGCGLIITQERDYPTLRLLLNQLMKQDNLTWKSLVTQFRLNSEFFQDDVNCQTLIRVLRDNLSLSKSMSYDYFEQMQIIYLDMLDIYSNISSLMNDEIIQRGEIAIKTPKVRVFRIIRKDILKLMTDLIRNTRNYNIIKLDIIPPLFKTTLEGYQYEIPSIKEFELLNCLTTMLEKCGNKLVSEVGSFLPYIFGPTLRMINKDFISYPDHRHAFYKLLNSINRYCFQVFLELPVNNFKLFFDSICWALKHTERKIESTGIDTAMVMMRNIDTHYRDSNIAQMFFQQYYLIFINETFYVLTEPDHKATFTEQTMLLMRLINLSISDVIPVQIYEKMDAPVGTTNRQYLMKYLSNLLCGAFSNLTRNQVDTFLTVLVGQLGDSAHFKATLRDFLVQIKEVGGDPSDYLFAEDREKEIQTQREAQQERASRIAGLSQESNIMF